MYPANANTATINTRRPTEVMFIDPPLMVTLLLLVKHRSSKGGCESISARLLRGAEKRGHSGFCFSLPDNVNQWIKNRRAFSPVRRDAASIGALYPFQGAP